VVVVVLVLVLVLVLVVLVLVLVEMVCRLFGLGAIVCYFPVGCL
jgi:hypothetical protein